MFVNRVTDPEHVRAVEVPPLNQLEPVARAWAAAGLSVDTCFRKAVSVTDEWIYVDAAPRSDPCACVADRLLPQRAKKRRVLLRLKALPAVGNLQPRRLACSKV